MEDHPCVFLTASVTVATVSPPPYRPRLLLSWPGKAPSESRRAEKKSRQSLRITSFMVSEHLKAQKASTTRCFTRPSAWVFSGPCGVFFMPSARPDGGFLWDSVHPRGGQTNGVQKKPGNILGGFATLNLIPVIDESHGQAGSESCS